MSLTFVAFDLETTGLDSDRDAIIEIGCVRFSGDEVVDRFTAEVHAGGLRVTLRRDRGRDIDAACGQLATRSSRARRGRGSDARRPPVD